jgi:DNA polymerase-2
MPTIRGSTQGSKKRYCGAVVNPDGTLRLVFKGLESARSDWTEAARRFQTELYWRVFAGQPVEELVLRTAREVRGGKQDELLVYRKRLNKQLDEYGGAAPPHVQAARQLGSPGTRIAYCITTQGPQPAESRTAPLDYDHYIDAQIRPVADSILEWLGLSFDKITSGQVELFG